MIIDHQAHWYTPAYLDSIAGRSGYPRTEALGDGRYRFESGAEPGAWRFEIQSRFWDIDEQIAAMDSAGIGMAVISANMLGEVAALDLSEARDTIALVNEEMARVQREFPDRLVSLCMLPMQNTDAAIEALDRAAQLDLRGVLMASNVAGRPLGAEETWPIFERIDELGLPIFLHPAHNSMLYDRGLIDVLDWSAGWLFDSSAAALSLILSGILDRCPRIEVVHPHLGGIVPYIVGRTSRYANYLPRPLERPVEEYLTDRFYVDVVTHTPAAVPLAVQSYGAERLLFGTDYAWHLHDEAKDFVDEHFPEDLARKVLNENRVASLRLSGPSPAHADAPSETG